MTSRDFKPLDELITINWCFRNRNSCATMISKNSPNPYKAAIVRSKAKQHPAIQNQPVSKFPVYVVKLAVGMCTENSHALQLSYTNWSRSWLYTDRLTLERHQYGPNSSVAETTFGQEEWCQAQGQSERRWLGETKYHASRCFGSEQRAESTRLVLTFWNYPL